MTEEEHTDPKKQEEVVAGNVVESVLDDVEKVVNTAKQIRDTAQNAHDDIITIVDVVKDSNTDVSTKVTTVVETGVRMGTDIIQTGERIVEENQEEIKAVVGCFANIVEKVKKNRNSRAVHPYSTTGST